MKWICVCVCVCAVSSCRLVCMQKRYHLTHTCIKGLWIIKQTCIFFAIWSKKLWSFLHSGTTPLLFSVDLPLRSVEISTLCETSFLVPYHSDVMVSALTGKFPFGIKLSPWERDRTGGDVHKGKYSTPINSLCAWLHPRGKQICFLWGHTPHCQWVSSTDSCHCTVHHSYEVSCDEFLKSSLRS